MRPAASMVALVEAYLDERRQLGFELDVPGSQLMGFAHHADQIGHTGSLTKHLIEDWVQGKARRTGRFSWAQRLKVIRPFARYLARFDQDTEVPRADLFGSPTRRLAPHIFTDGELAELLAAPHRLPVTGWIHPTTYEMIFGLLTGTGMRISEALNLRCDDVDLDHGVLTVRLTKFRKSRLVPLHPTVVTRLRSYSAWRRQTVTVTGETFFFLSRVGRQIGLQTVEKTFRQIRSDLGWQCRGGHPTNAKASGRGLRIIIGWA